MLDFLFLTSISVTFSQVLFISFFISSWFSSLLWSIQPVFLTVPIEVFTHPCVPSNLTLISELFFLCFPVLSGCIFFSPCKKSLCLNLYCILFISWIKKGFFPPQFLGEGCCGRGRNGPGGFPYIFCYCYEILMWCFLCVTVFSLLRTKPESSLTASIPGFLLLCGSCPLRQCS